MEFSRQEYWSGLPIPSPGDLPDPGIKPGSSALKAEAFSLKQIIKCFEGDYILVLFHVCKTIALTTKNKVFQGLGGGSYWV